MTYSRRLGGFLLLPSIVLGYTSTAPAGMWDDPQNLEVLPADISAEDLRSTMRRFSRDTGSRCSTCHVHEDEADMRTYDFASDDIDTKKRARQMIRLVNEINASLADKLGTPDGLNIEVECATCHRGRSRPELLHDVLERTYRDDGMAGAAAEYRRFREQYYGRQAFDFGEGELMLAAENLADAGDHEGALGFLDLNLEFYPDFARAHVLKAQVQAASGDTAGARESLLRAIDLEPDNAWNRRLLERLDEN